MKHLLIIWHSRTGAAEQMAQALVRGATDAARALEQTASLQIHLQPARATQPADLIAADGYLFCAPENLASLTGEMKECLDRCYYRVLDELQGRPYAVAISAGTDGAGAARQLERICTGWRLRAIAPALIERNGAQTPEAILAPKTVPPDALARCHELGGLLAATLLVTGS
ncbi:flavodoxin family protein [Bordetella tumulicola]|uniref:flavodoxin family protein n=1 Tax=Bordetella tumulicola TaxID=1649133 RepID=UPI0039EE1DC4